ncbi:hypothetical protein PT276_08155 [Orbaceae bacterium ESL0721]|nr:hypothetical protein [Orbaceae bacterium ESL0721]
MAKIPQFGTLQLNGAKSSSANLPTNIISTAPGLHTLGKGIGAIADLILQKRKEDDQLQMQKSLLDLDEYSNDQLNNPDTGYKNMQGENAIKNAGKYSENYTNKINQIRDTLKDNFYLKKFDLQTQAMALAHNRQIMLHESQQQSKLALDTLTSGIDLAITNAQTLYNDHTSLLMGYNNIMSRVDEFSEQQGMTAELRKQQKDSIAQKYFSASLDGWIAHTELVNGSFMALQSDIKKSLPFQKLTEINKAKYLLKIDALTKKQGNVDKDNLNLDLTNAWAMQQRGIQADDIPEQRFISVLGSQAGKRAFDNYRDGQTMALNIASMQNTPTKDLIAKYQHEEIDQTGDQRGGLTANTKDDSFANRLRLQGVQSKAATTLLKVRADDPIAAAFQAGEVSEVDFSLDSLTKRTAQAERISQDYQTPLRVFSNAESKKLSDIVNSASAIQQAELLKTFSQAAEGNDKVYAAMLNDIGQENPAFAIAGTIMNSPSGKTATTKNGWFFDNNVTAQATASFILKGAEALKGTGKGGNKVPGVSLPAKMDATFDTIAGDLFKDNPQARQAIYSAATAYYTGKAISNGNFSSTHDLNLNLLKESINAVAGNTSSKYNVRMPWGMDSGTFDNLVEYQYEAAAKMNGWKPSRDYEKYGYDPSDPQGLSSKAIKDRFELIPATYSSGLPDGKYLLRAGNGFLVDNKGEPVVIDVLESTKHIKDIPE